MKSSATPLAAVVALLSLCVSHTSSAAPETVLVIGDSLSREYQFEFPEFEDARNWVELLAENRPDEFDFGTKRPTNRYEHNWALPTYSASDFADLVTGGSLAERLYQDQLDDDFDEVDAVVVFLGGNDIDSVYGPLYNGNQSATDDIIERIENDLEDIIDFVLDDTPTMRMILVNVPHVGATPEVKGDHPTDPVKTGRVTTALQTLDTNLRALADRKDIGYADLLPLTIDLLDDDPFCIAGFPFINEGDDDGAPEYMWLGGDISQDFHPNTNGQAIVANAIIAGFNEKYGIGATPFGESEIVEELVGLEAPLTTWARDAGLPASERAPLSDPDGDGLSNLIEFMLELDPAAWSSLPSPTISAGQLTFEYSPRPSTCFAITPEFSTDLIHWSDIPAEFISSPSANLVRISFPVTGRQRFIRLRID